MEKQYISTKSPAKDVFAYLLMIIMLTVGVVSFTAILWQYINISFPDPLEYYRSGALDIIKNSIASLVVVWPVFIFLSHVIGKDLSKNEDKQHIWIRKWLLYLTLFVSSLAVIVDLVSMINRFLGGELTTRFALKVFVILLAASAVFAYYLWELRRDPSKNTRLPFYGAVVSSVVILIAVIAGFLLVGSPSHQRDLRMDEQRLQDLQSIQGQVLYFWQQKGLLPVDLADLSDPLYGYNAPIDPISGEGYSYTVTGDLNFTLCATFVTKSDESVQGANARQLYPGEENGEFWTHEEGEACFERTIDPDLYAGSKSLPVPLRF